MVKSSSKSSSIHFSKVYCHFNKVIKGAGTSFQSPVLSQEHVRNVFETRIRPNFILIVFRIQKK